MCLVVKDQGEDLREWVDYHQRIGANKFYIFDDNSSVPVLPEIEDLVKSGEHAMLTCYLPAGILMLTEIPRSVTCQYANIPLLHTMPVFLIHACRCFSAQE